MCFSATIAPPSFEEYPLNTDAVGPAPPDAFGPFRVLHQIGAGALGPVFRAYQPEQDRLVAVKLLRLDLPPERTHQLVAELEKLIAADLAHPGIAAPLAVGISDVSAYLAQDFVAADSLDIVVRDTVGSNPADVARVVSQLGGALDFAAASGITHGALHPRDVLLSPDDVRITGMGITRALERVGVAAPIRRPYTAPERAAGRPWDRRADVFSLAALGFELLCRRRIAGVGDRAAEAIGEIRGANSERLRQAFARALAEDPDDRFATAGDFAQAVEATLDQKRNVSARGEPTAFGRSTLTPPPAAELPLLTDAMLSDAAEPSPAADAPPPPIAELFKSGPSIVEAETSADESRFSTIDSEPIADHRLRTNDSRLATDDFEEIIQPDGAEVPSRPAIFAPSDPGDRSASHVWPLMLALVVGIGLGFGMAMLLLGRDRVSPASEQAGPATAPLSAPVEVKDEPVREFTERAVPDAPKPPTSSGSVAPVPVKPPAVAPSLLAGSADELRHGSPPLDNARGGRQPVERPDRQGRGGPSPVARASVARAPVAKPPAAKVPVAKTPVATAPTPKVTKPTAAASASARSTTRPVAAKPAPVPPAKTGPGSLVVDSRPTGASVFVDGRLIGRTPLVVDAMGAGEHAIHLDRDGYRRWATAVRIVSGERSRVAASLER